MNITDDELIQELNVRFAQSKKAFSDLTVLNRKLMEMNRRLEDSEALKTNFLSNIRNEIVNPLNVIMGWAGILAAGGVPEIDVPAVASTIVSEAAYLNFQLRNIFMAAELEAGTVEPHFTHTDIFLLLSDVVESFRHVAARRSVRIQRTHSTPGATVEVACDAEKLRLILSNLLANAIEYSEDGETVDVDAHIDAAGSLVVAVQDHGPGIAPEDVKRIFDRFVQLDTGTTRSHLGHGLGLSICRALAELLQGQITVESEPGRGALFSVTLPPPSLAESESFDDENIFVFDATGQK